MEKTLVTIKWNRRVIESFDLLPHLEKVPVKYHMFSDKEVSCHGTINQVLKIWELLAEFHAWKTHVKLQVHTQMV